MIELHIGDIIEPVARAGISATATDWPFDSNVSMTAAT